MKKILCSLMLVAGLGTQAHAVGVAGLEISPEIGFAGGSLKAGSAKASAYGAFGRIWLGAAGFVVAPQVKYDSLKFSSGKFSNTQYGLSVGYNIGLVIAKLTPYLGVNYSSFNKGYKSTMAYNAGLKLKFDLLPISLGILYTWQNPEVDSGSNAPKVKMQSIQGLIALHF